jgi:hypothetical protein
MRITLGETLAGPAGEATELVVHDADGPTTATVACWWLHCPGQSVAWDRYMLAAIHLRPIEGQQPAVVRVPHATHEVMLVALNPEKGPAPTDPATWQYLQPINLQEQVQLPDDATAVAMLRDCARAVVDGVLWAEAPLSGQVEPWRTSLIKTSAHLRGEEHAP